MSAACCLGGCGSDDESTAAPPTTPQHPVDEHEIPVVLPACDPADPTVRFLATEEDWADLNDEAYRIFCVAPGDYTGLGNVRLARDGTAEAPRFLRLYDPDAPSDETHPARLAEQDRAVIGGLLVTEAYHWVVDRITVRGDWTVVRFEDGSQNNVLNRILAESATVVFQHGAHDNTLQNSVVRDAPKTPNADRVCVVLSGSNDGADVAIHGTRIVRNEIYDCTDSIQAWRVDGSDNLIDFGGTLIANNDLYLTDGMYSDCAGALDPNGACACAENAIDLKAAGSGPGSIVEVTGNRMWGFRGTDTACGGTGSGGAASVVHMTARYTLYQGNLIWNVPRAMTFLNDHHSAVDNVIYDVHVGDADGTAIYPEATTSEFYRNVIIDVDRWAAAYGDDGDYRCNTLISAGRNTAAGAGLQADYNFYYDSAQMALPGDHDIVEEDATAALHTDLCFEVRPWTGPEQICIPNGSPTSASPHAGACDPALGSRPNVGVDDTAW